MSGWEDELNDSWFDGPERRPERRRSSWRVRAVSITPTSRPQVAGFGDEPERGSLSDPLWGPIDDEPDGR